MMGQMKCERIEPLFGCGIAGILRACEGMEGLLPIVHGPVGCASGHRIYPLFADKEPLCVSTSMTEIDIVMGSEQRLKAAVEKGIAIYHPKVIVVILTCGTNMTGEIHPALGARLEQQYGIPCFVLNGSGIELDEQTAYMNFLQAFDNWETARRQPDAKWAGYELRGFSRSDFNCLKDLHAVERLLSESLNIIPSRILFNDFNIGSDDGKTFTPIQIANAWHAAEKAEPAPVGAAGILRWLESVSSTVGKEAGSEFLLKISGLEAEQRELAASGRLSGLRIGIECGSWLGLGLARFLNEECGCKVLLSTDKLAEAYVSSHEFDFEVLEDTGNMEFADALDDFGADIVFGTSYSKTTGRPWVPVWQPVWHVIDEQESMLCIDGTRHLMRMLVKFTEER